MKSFNNYLNESKKLDDYIFEEEIIQEGFWSWLGGILAAGLALVGAGIAKLFKWMFSEAEKNVKENGGEYKVNDESVGILTGGRGEGSDDEDGNDKDGKKSKDKGKGLDEKKIIVGAMDDKQIDKFLSITKSNSGGPFNDYYKFISNYDEDKKVKQTIYVNYDKDTVCLMFLQSDDEQNFYIEHITPYKGINIEKNIFAIVKDKLVSILKNTYSTYANLRVSYKDALKYFDGLKFSKKYKAYVFPDDIGDEKPKNNGQLSKEEIVDFIKNPSKYPISINKVDKEALSKWCEKEGKDDNKDYFNTILKYQSDNDSLSIYSMFIERQISEANEENKEDDNKEEPKAITIGVMFLDESQKESVAIENICFVPSIDGEDLPETLLTENIFTAIEKTLSIKKENINISNDVAKKFNSKAKSTQMLPQEVVDDVVNHPEKREVVINEIEKDALNKWCETIGKDQNQKTYYDKISEYQKKHDKNLIYSLVVSTEVKEAEEKKEDNVGIIGVMFVSKIEDEVKENLNVFEEEEKKDEPKEDNKEEKKDDSENKEEKTEEKSAKYRIERIYFVNELLHDTVNMKSTMLTDNIIKQLEEKLSVKGEEIALSKEVEKQFQINTDKDNDKESSEKDDESKGNDSDKDNDKEDKEDEKEKDKEKTKDDKLIPDEIVEAIHNDMKDLTLDIEELKDKKDFEKLINEIKENKKYDVEKITQFQKDNENDDIFKINVSKEKDSYIIGFIFLGEKINEAEESDKAEIYFHQAFTIFEDEPGDKFKEEVHNALDKWSKESGFEIVYNDDYNDEFNNPEEADKEEDKEDKEDNKETEEVKKEIEQKSEETEKEIEKTEKEVVQELDDNEDLDNDDIKDQKKEIKKLTAEQKKKIKELEKEYQKKVEEMDEKHSKERKGHSMKEYEEIIEKQDKELEELKAEYDKKIENIVKNVEKSEDKEEKEEKKEKKEKTDKDDDKDEKTSKENKDKKDDKKSLKETPKEDKKEKVKKEAEEVNKEAKDIKKEVEDLTESKDPYKNINKNLEDKLNITLALFIKKQEEFNKAFNSWKEATINKDETKAKEFEKKFNKAKNDLELIKIELNNNKENLKNFKNPTNVIDEGLDTDNLDWKLSAWFSRDSKQKDLFNRVLNDPSTLEIALTDGFDMQGLVNFTYDNVKSDTEVDYVYQLEQLLNYLKGGK